MKPNSIAKNVLAGIAGGLLGTLAMDTVQKLLYLGTEGDPIGLGTAAQERNHGERATERAARRLSRAVLDREPGPVERKVEEKLLHYAFGGSMGALEGLLASFLPNRRHVGVGFGALVWLGGDELMNRISGLARRQDEFPARSHLSGLLINLVYGLMLDAAQSLAARRAPWSMARLASSSAATSAPPIR